MNKLRQLLEEKFPHGWPKLYRTIGYPTSYKVTSHTNPDLEKATYAKMEPWEVVEWSKALEEPVSTLLFDYGCGLEGCSGAEINQLLQEEGYSIGAVAHAA